VVNPVNGCPVIEGVLKGYSYSISSDNFVGGLDEFPKPADIPAVFAFSLLLENADNVTPEIEIDHIPEISTSIRNINQNNLSLNIFPNPTTEKIQIEYQINKSSDINIQVININGRNIMDINLPNQSIGKHSEIIDLKKLSSGIYFCTVQSEYEIITQKIIKN